MHKKVKIPGRVNEMQNDNNEQRISFIDNSTASKLGMGILLALGIVYSASYDAAKIVKKASQANIVPKRKGNDIYYR
jgi:hypothetical protein